MKAHTFEFLNHDFGDDHESVWVAALVDGVEGALIGAYVDRGGDVRLYDHVQWCVDLDLEDMGLDPESDEAQSLLDQWCPIARAHGLALLAKSP